MEALETFVVESPVQSEGDAYKSIVADIITELVLGGSIGRIKVIVRPEESLYLMAVILRGSQPRVKVSDMASVDISNHLKKEITISVEQEKYLPELLEKLWAKYGRAKVYQPERKTLIMTAQDVDAEKKFLADMVVADPQSTLQSRLVEMAIRATPEGFRVRYHSMDGHRFVFAASEDILKPEWIQEARDLAEELMEGE
ncbi:methanogenesis marker 17 protein [Methanolobus profundi]|uniref:Putative methanogenesis marker protein 17 n=1 Tax=Methanolobus profundi TaxID=487685 RepID=A0A1I4SWK1_9EURY|nr:methanogenesis marker 17 protein [Methanolobus profundi]SFM68693.1 putative methanogenesis marker protein 17 [Methanolobus profundi]